MTPSSANLTNGSGPKDSSGWDGKLRVEKKAVLANPDALSDPEYSDQDAPPVEQIGADEDLLDEYDVDAEEIDLVHCRVSSVPSLQLGRFTKLERLCLRQNQITQIEFAESLGTTLQELDLYDNLISHIKGLDTLVWLKSLDLSFNKIKHIKNIGHLKELTDLYFVQNKIQKIEGLEGLSRIRNLELAANRIREIENLDTLRSLQELWLGKNKITELKNLSTLSNLKILSIQSNRISQLTGLSSLPSLEELYISHNALSSMSGLENNHSLRVLDISNNMITNLNHVRHLNSLEELWASNNQLSSFIEVGKELSGKTELTTVYFEGNPLQLQNPVLYRNKIRLALPQVKQIDATFVQVS
ncbi:Protein phosphatase 1 regulatory subunit sds22 [Xylographa bjoerkii]|nr:Protein phosphatase 1 regulatory subunit sds22 [Xylographa bjoerkii]